MNQINQLKELILNLSPRQRIIIAAVAVLVAASLFAAARWKRERDFRPLYTDLSAEDAGAVVQKLRETGTEYRLAQNGSEVLVPSSRAAELRLQFAAAGLPKTGRAGFELFDKTNFGATEFAEHINYQRAVEGELERSIMSLAEVEQARVHVTFPKESVFVESREPAKASVLLKLRRGAKLAPPNVAAIRQLIASAVEGLGPEAVSILDMHGNLLSRRPDTDLNGDHPTEAALEYRQQIEKNLLAKINGTLDALAGPERYRAGVSVECDFTAGEQTDETYDPSRSVMTNSQKMEETGTANSASGVPGTASSLPRPAFRPGLAGYGSTRRSETISYQSSRVLRHVKLPQGNIKRISAAVLLDQALRWEGVGPKARRILEPLPPEKLKSVRDVVAGAIGFDSARGDQLIVETLPFEATLSVEPPPAPAAPEPGAWTKLGPGLGVALVLVLVGSAAFSMMKRRRKVKLVALEQALAAPQQDAQTAIEAAPSIDLVEQAEAEFAAKLAEHDAERQRLEAEAINSIKVPVPSTKKAEVLTKHISETIEKDAVAAAQILRTWIHEGGGR
ncbi:MAG: flagellar basal-body MS-ring/collar protein FliF [Acidobacteriota bacterium]